jgi:L-alanine-DL-glutamate epimerase-like enolase superfamily enzyme
MPDVTKIGGVTGWLKAAALAEMRGLQMSSHIFQEISAHLLAVTPTAHWLERMDLAAPGTRQTEQFVAVERTIRLAEQHRQQALLQTRKKAHQRVII